MSKVEFNYSKGGKKVLMATRYAETLRKLGHGTYQTKVMMAAEPTLVIEEPRTSEAILAFAEEHNVDISKVVGTGKDGRIKKSDVEAFIDAQDLA